jgi:hypothetical protein
MQSYLIAKYVDDIRRNEPINVGVIVFDGSGFQARFEGEDENAHLDRRRIRRLVTGRDAYTAWVRHWRRVLEEVDDPTALLRAGSQDFFVETGGQIVLDYDNRALEETARELYARLVKPEDPPAPKSLQDKSQQAIRLAGVDLDDPERFRRDWSVDIRLNGQDFSEPASYGVRNGAWHLLQEVSFDSQRPQRSRKEANHCAFLVEHAVVEGQKLVLYDGADIDDSTEPLLRLVRAAAPAIDVDNSQLAAESLESALSLAAA